MVYNKISHWGVVDAINSTVFVDYAELNEFLPMAGYFKGKPTTIQEESLVLEDICQQGAVKINLDPTVKAKGQKGSILLSTRPSEPI